MQEPHKQQQDLGAWKDVVYYRTDGYPDTADTESWFEDQQTPIIRLDTPLYLTLDALVLPVFRSGNVQKALITRLSWEKKCLRIVVPRTPWTSRLLHQILDSDYIRGILSSEYWEAFRAFQKTWTRQEKWILHAITNMSHFHILPYFRTGKLPSVFLQRVPRWGHHAEKHGLFPLAPVLIPDRSFNAKTYHALLERLVSITPKELEIACDAWIRHVDELFSRCPRLIEPMVVFRGLKTSVPDEYYEQAYTSTTLSFFHALHYKSKKENDPCCIQRITIPVGIPVLFLETVSSFRGEWEILLPRKLTFRVHQRHLVRVPESEKEWKSHPPRRFTPVLFQETSIHI